MTHTTNEEKAETAYESTIDQILSVTHEEGPALRIPVSFIDEYIDEDVQDIISEMVQELIEVYYLEFDSSGCAGEGWPNSYEPPKKGRLPRSHR